MSSKLSRIGLLAAALLAAGLAACNSAGVSSRECNVNADCASRKCNPDGTCEPYLPDAGQGGSATGGQGGAGGFGGGTGGSGNTGGAGACQPNGDGTITAAELPLGPGLAARFRISEDVAPFSSAPDCSTSPCVWDLVDVGGVTHEEDGGTEPIDGKWYAGAQGFENATYVSKASEFKLSFGIMTLCEQVQYGVFQVTDFGLLLLGIASEHEDGGTLLVYDPPVPMLQYPMSVGSTWQLDTVATGPLCGSVFDYYISMTFQLTVDATGDVLTPYGEFHNVLRVSSLMQRHLGVGVMPTELRTHTFVAECFTTIAAVQSLEGVSEPEFTAAAEVRRLAPMP